MKRLTALLLVFCLILAGCVSGAPADTTPEATTTAAPTTTAEPTTTAAPETTPVPTTTVPETTPVPTEALPYTHPITGEKLAQPETDRPVGVVINNMSEAQPIHGVGNADALFEIMAEGGGTITRFVAIFTDLQNTGNIGSIRSARTYLIDLARSFDAPIVHCGGSTFALEELNTSKWPDLDEIYNGRYFYRNQDRLNAGYSREHTLFTTGEQLLQGLTDRGRRVTLKEGQTFGLTFSEEDTLSGTAMSSVTFYYSENGKSTTMTYDPATGNYYGTQGWRSGVKAELIDGNTGEKIPFRNVFIMHAKSMYAQDGVHKFWTLTGEGKGYYLCGGEYVPIIWSRSRNTDPFQFTLEDGTPITLGIGKSYFAVIPTNAGVEFQ